MKQIFRIIPAVFLLFYLAGCAASARFKNGETSDIPTRETPIERYETFDNSGVLHSEEGIASYYAHKYHGRTTSNGETFNMFAYTAAHKTMAFNTIVRITNLSNNKKVTVRINDRMPPYNERMIDLSLKAAEDLDMIQAGITKVRLEVLKWGK